MKLTQCITVRTVFLFSLSVGLNIGVMGLVLPSQAIAASEISTVANINNQWDLQKSPLSPPDTNEPQPKNIQGGA